MASLYQPLVLVGPMGVGKTTIGKKLAKALGLDFVDTDAVLVADHGSISEIFAKLGEPKFRELEEQAVAEALKSVAVIATGGGAVMSRNTQNALKSNATVCYLSTDGRHMASRLSNGNRPLLANGIDGWKDIYEQRRRTYEAVANFEIDTSSKPLAAIVQEIKSQLGINE